MKLTIDKAELKALESAGIVEFKGISGEPTTAETAAQAPTLVRAYALSGKVFEMSANGDGSYTLTEI